MEAKPQKAFLLIADISGYTKFMTRTKMSLAHAQVIITELMKSIISEIKIPLHIVEIEGDAIFFYGVEERGTYTWDQVVSLISEKILVFFRTFYSRLNDLKQSNMCHCNSCDGIGDLKLKIIVHMGDVLFYQIENFSKLSGPDVILVHRLLKNSIKADEYLLMTERSFLEMSKYYTFESDKGLERYEDLGEIKVYVHYPNLIKPDKEETADEYYKVSFYKKMKKTMKIGMNGMLIMLGLRRLPQFHNLPK